MLSASLNKTFLFLSLVSSKHYRCIKKPYNANMDVYKNVFKICLNTHLLYGSRHVITNYCNTTLRCLHLSSFHLNITGALKNIMLIWMSTIKKYILFWFTACRNSNLLLFLFLFVCVNVFLFSKTKKNSLLDLHHHWHCPC